MSLEEGHQYLHGRLGRDWEQKATKSGDVVYETSLAYQLTKDDDTVWVDLTVWPVKSTGSTAPGDAIAAASGKGTMVIVRGPVKSREYVSKKTQTPVTGWSMSVYNCGICPKVDWGQGGGERPAKNEPPAPVTYDPGEEPF